MSDSNRRNSGATFQIPYISEEKSMAKSCENLVLTLDKNRPRSCSPNFCVSTPTTQGKLEKPAESRNANKETPTTSTGATPKNSNPLNKINQPTIQIGLDRYITVKRKRSPTSNEDQSAKIIKGKKSEIRNTENRFAILQNDNDDRISAGKPSKPPPIYLRERNSNALVQSLVKLLGENSFYVVPIKKGNINETKIQVNGENEYRKVVAELEKLNKNFYTYQMKSSKGLQVVLKGIDSIVEPAEIKLGLEEKGFKPKIVFNIKNREKVPQPLFLVELEPGDIKLKKNEIHPIYSLKYFLYRKITVEEPHKRSGPVQCMNCQEYGHTKAYCKLTSVCVACGELHSTSQCRKPRNDYRMKKCSNCGGNHTANYRGCPVYAKIKKAMEPKQKISTGQAANIAQNVINCPPLPQSYVGTASYAGALRKNDVQPQAKVVNSTAMYLNQQPNATSTSYAGVLRPNQPQPQGSQVQDKSTKKRNATENEQTPIYYFARLESTIETLVQTVNNFTTSMSSMMQEMLRMQSMLLQAVLNKP